MASLTARRGRRRGPGPASGRPPVRQAEGERIQLAGILTGASAWDSGNMVRCMIVDDCPEFLRAARSLLEGQGMTVVGVASNGLQALRQARQFRPDVALVDIDLGGECGLELAGRLRRETGPSPPLVVLVSIHAEDDYAGMIEGSVAVGFLAKTDLSGNAIRALLAEWGSP
ncbi:response regulator [Streptomyces spiralis]|uniref:response regulator n=1 Tax=Streptomyces spiralis TaxID=66376 RepID=UPI0027E446FE|nr:response regulator [Streptomyces spiralis]